MVALPSGELKKRQKAVSSSQLAGYRFVKVPHFGTAPRRALALMPGLTITIWRSTNTCA